MPEATKKRPKVFDFLAAPPAKLSYSPSSNASAEIPFHSPSTSATVRAVTTSPAILSVGLLIVGIRARAQASFSRSSTLRHGQVTIRQPANGQLHGDVPGVSAKLKTPTEFDASER